MLLSLFFMNADYEKWNLFYKGFRGIMELLYVKYLSQMYESNWVFIVEFSYFHFTFIYLKEVLYWFFLTNFCLYGARTCCINSRRRKHSRSTTKLYRNVAESREFSSVTWFTSTLRPRKGVVYYLKVSRSSSSSTNVHAISVDKHWTCLPRVVYIIF